MSSISVADLVLVSVVSVLFYWLLIRRKRRLPPGPMGLPVLGNLLLLLIGRRPLYEKFLALRKRYGDVFSLKIGPTTIVVLANCKLIREVLVQKAGFTDVRPPVMRNTDRSKGIIWNSGQQWHNLRKFSLVTLKDFGVGKKSLEARIYDEVNEISGVIESYDGKPFTMKGFIGKAVSNIICGIIFGSRFEYNDKEFQRLLNLLEDLFMLGQPHLVISRNSLFYRCFAQKHINASIKNSREIDEFLQKIVKEHEQTFQADNVRDFIDLYLKLSEEDRSDQSYSEKHIFQIIRDLFTAGSETSTSTLRWLFLYMIRFPKVQERCRNEIREIAGFSRMVQLDDKPKMPYVCATMNEVQRLRTIAPVGVPHGTTEDFTLAGYTIPKNSTLLTHIYAAHMDPRYWPDPEEFKPERWIDRHGNLVRHDSFFPFSLGPRSCLGENLARTEMFLFFANLLQRFTFVCPAGERPTLDDVGKFFTVQPFVYRLCATTN